MFGLIDRVRAPDRFQNRPVRQHAIGAREQREQLEFPRERMSCRRGRRGGDRSPPQCRAEAAGGGRIRRKTRRSATRSASSSSGPNGLRQSSAPRSSAATCRWRCAVRTTIGTPEPRTRGGRPRCLPDRQAEIEHDQIRRMRVTIPRASALVRPRPHRSRAIAAAGRAPAGSAPRRPRAGCALAWSCRLLDLCRRLRFGGYRSNAPPPGSFPADTRPVPRPAGLGDRQTHPGAGHTARRTGAAVGGRTRAQIGGGMPAAIATPI